MTGSGLFVIQKAIFTALTGDATLMALTPRIYDDVPSPGVFPYVVLGDVTEAPFRVFGNGGHDETVTIHVWSQYQGFKEGFDIVNRITTVLEAGSLAVDTHTTVFCNHEQNVTLRDPDGITRHIAARYRVIVQDVP